MYAARPRLESAYDAADRLDRALRWAKRWAGGGRLRRVRWWAAGAAAIGLLALAYAQAADEGASVGAATVTVAPGDTLWGIASRRYPDADAREKVQQIERLNGLRGPGIEAGQRLRVPER